LDESQGVKSSDEITIEQLEAWSRIASLGHSPERLVELAPKVRALFDTIARLREADVEGCEMAVNYQT
jgi:Asp-tRNA(Asn)/Glu-tRNA(Gln) amidotransferase C subunit